MWVYYGQYMKLSGITTDETSLETKGTTVYKNNNTVEPLNKGHVGSRHCVLCREVVCFSEVQK